MNAPGALPWLARPGLAGGIDKDGSRAAELLGLGFGSVEFGSVTVHPVAGSNPGLAALVARLSALDRSAPQRTAIGIGLGLPPEATAETLADEWQAGLAAAWPVADYVSLNLSARANQRFLAPVHRRTLLAALRTVAACRDRLAEAGRRVLLAIKIPLAEAAGLLETMTETGFAQLTVVRPDHRAGFDELADLTGGIGRPALVAVGGIRNAADVAAARAAGAAGVQLHRLFIEHGAGCLAHLT
ncbi:dihydroorotate dehydrogenase [Dechloromonas sp. H13]|uniref:dihydroorotate dehydrogenase n=1 Tax=Dechloromonas sp. H13 TaxID=2570193 RepID=UPI0012921799|nr:dihydroorotate dehydrogenase [Dechloromonas sp. H13]